MTEEKNYDFERYQFGALAGRFAGSEESAPYVPSALEALAGPQGLNLGEDAQGFVKGSFASEEGIKTAVGIYAGKFEEKRSSYKPVELLDWYDFVNSDLAEDEREKLKNYLGGFDETLGSIKAKVDVAAWKLKAPKGAVTDEDTKRSQETMKKYGDLFKTLGALDKFKFENLRPGVVSNARKQTLKGLVSKL